MQVRRSVLDIDANYAAIPCLLRECYVLSTTSSGHQAVMLSTRETSLVLDAKGLLCPIPVMKTSQAIKQVRVGEVLEVVTTDPGAKPDLTAWTKMTGNELISVFEESAIPKTFRFRIRRLK